MNLIINGLVLLTLEKVVEAVLFAQLSFHVLADRTGNNQINIHTIKNIKGHQCGTYLLVKYAVHIPWPS